jgi:hypothetical protein
MPSVQFVDRSCRWWLRHRRLLVEPPWVAALFKLRDSMVRDGVTLVLGQTLFQTTYDFSGAPECESDRVPKHFSLGHASEGHKENTNSSHYILRAFREVVTTKRRRESIECANVSP